MVSYGPFYQSQSEISGEGEKHILPPPPDCQPLPTPIPTPMVYQFVCASLYELSYPG